MFYRTSPLLDVSVRFAFCARFPVPLQPFCICSFFASNSLIFRVVLGPRHFFGAKDGYINFIIFMELEGSLSEIFHAPGCAKVFSWCMFTNHQGRLKPRVGSSQKGNFSVQVYLEVKKWNPVALSWSCGRMEKPPSNAWDPPIIEMIEETVPDRKPCEHLLFQLDKSRRMLSLKK